MKIIQGKTHRPQRLVVYGPSGVGKSSFACGVDFPSTVPSATVLSLDYERGLDQIGPSRVEGPDRWEASLDLIREVCTGKGEWRTVVIDTIDKLEDQCGKAICEKGKKGSKLESLADFGWNDGYEMQATKWRELLFLLESAQSHGRSVILVAHVKRETLDDPTLGRVAKWVAALHKLCWAATHRWADAILFANYDQGLADGRALMLGGRSLHTVAGSGFDAKNRWGLPAQLPLSWSAYEHERTRRMRSPEEILSAITSLEKTAEGVDRPAFESALRAAGQDVGKLIAVENVIIKKQPTQQGR